MDLIVCTWVSVSYTERLGAILPILFLFCGVWLARRNRYPILVLGLPIVVNTAAVASGLYQVARAIGMSGGGRHASAAGVASTLFIWIIAGAASSLLALLFALFYPKERQPDVRDESVSWLILSAVAVFAGAMLWFAGEFTTPEVRLFPQLFMYVQAALSLAAIYTAMGIVVVISGFRKHPPLVPPRGSFVILAVACGAFAYLMYTIVRTYQLIAMGA